jgi:shikimate kinase
MTPLLVLVGPPGAGKTTVGRLVAGRRGVAFRDTDLDIADRAGRSVADIFLYDGEATFRTLERDAIREALSGHDGVLALGGGALGDSATRERLAGHHVVFLDVGLSDAAARIGLNRDRPLLLGNPRAQLKAMLDERRPAYQQVAVATVATDKLSPEDVADLVEAVL